MLAMILCMGNTRTAFANDFDSSLVPPDADKKELIMDEQMYQGKEMIHKNEEDISRSSRSIECEWFLRAYNNYTYIWAYSHSKGEFMDSMTTTCSAYYKSGKLIDQDIRSITGNIRDCSAIVEVPENPFNYQAYSAVSSHVFYKEGYTPLSATKSWQR